MRATRWAKPSREFRPRTEWGAATAGDGNFASGPEDEKPTPCGVFLRADRIPERCLEWRRRFLWLGSAEPEVALDPAHGVEGERDVLVERNAEFRRAVHD